MRSICLIASVFLMAGCGDDRRRGGSVDGSGAGDGDGQGGEDDGNENADPTPDAEGGEDQEGGGDGGLVGDPDCEDPDWCESEVEYMYDPAGDELETFPDDFYTADAEDSETGLRVWIDPDYKWLDSVPRGFENVYTDLTGLDGWGTTGGIVIRFTGEVTPPPSGPLASVDNKQVMLLDLGEDEPVRVPFEAIHTDEGKTIILWPLRPLRPGVRHAAVVTHRFPTAEAGCVQPSDRLKDLLTGTVTGDEWTRLVPRYAELLDKTGMAAHDIGAAVVFTTQTITTESEAIAKWIRESEVGWDEDFTCSVLPDFKRCEGSIAAHDFRRQGVVSNTEPTSDWELPVTFWLPKAGEGPKPMIILGHGLGGDRSNGGFIADVLAPRGIGIVAIDAPFHGDHPSASGGIGMMAMLDFFGVDILTTRVHGLKLRDSWRQATYDKLQLLQAMDLDPDIDGDGVADIDMDRIGYAGFSLGGIMGPELLAVTDKIKAALMSVCGGRLSTIVRDGDSFGPLLRQVLPAGITDGELDRFFPVMQALVERGDPVNYAGYILGNRLPDADGAIPSVLMQVAIGDATIPNTASNALARAMGITHVQPVLQTVGLIDTKPAPLSGNVADGDATAGFFQFDEVVVQMGGRPVRANHSNTVGSFEGFGQLMNFFESWLGDGPPTIVNPYDAL
jgi:pimeloyl-ACP methyl ester carboxylesterase